MTDTKAPAPIVPRQAESVLARVSQQLARLEKRDGELWLIITISGVLCGAGLLAIMFPSAFLGGEKLHIEVSVSRELFVGLSALLILLNTYIVSRRVELRRLRENLISSTVQGELSRLQSFTDPLTEIYNRRSLEDLAGRFVSHARRLHKPLTFMLIDADRFRDVNTRFGHLTGDFVLAEIASLLKNAVRGSDAVVRYGGDEFLVILADSSSENAAQVIDRISAYLREWNGAQHLEGFELSLSIGVSEWADSKSLDQLLEEADQDMYLGKENKRGMKT